MQCFCGVSGFKVLLSRPLPKSNFKKSISCWNIQSGLLEDYKFY